jgi:hypothetical protein
MVNEKRNGKLRFREIARPLKSASINKLVRKEETPKNNRAAFKLNV